MTLTGASTLNPSLSPPPLHQSFLQVCLSAACSRSVPRSTVQPALVSGERGRCIHMTVGVKLWEEQAPGWKTVTGDQLTAVNCLSVHRAGAWSRMGQAAGTSACGSSGASSRPSGPALRPRGCSLCRGCLLHNWPPGRSSWLEPPQGQGMCSGGGACWGSSEAALGQKSHLNTEASLC